MYACKYSSLTKPSKETIFVNQNNSFLRFAPQHNISIKCLILRNHMFCMALIIDNSTWVLKLWSWIHKELFLPNRHLKGPARLRVIVITILYYRISYDIYVYNMNKTMLWVLRHSNVIKGSVYVCAYNSNDVLQYLLPQNQAF